MNKMKIMENMKNMEDMINQQKRLPNELYVIIFRDMSVKELNEMMYVCKDWKDAINSSPSLYWWKHIDNPGLYLKYNAEINEIGEFSNSNMYHPSYMNYNRSDILCKYMDQYESNPSEDIIDLLARNHAIVIGNMRYGFFDC